MTRCRIVFVFVLSLFLALQLPFPTMGPSVAHAGGTIKIDDVRWVSLGAGLRTSFDMFQYGAPNGKSWSQDFAVDDLRLYLNAQPLELVTFEFNTEYQRTPGAGTETSSSIRILDGVAKFGFNDYVNVWFGRFLPPSDRSNLSGPFYLNAWDFPFVQMYPNIFAGRDDGAAIWGQVKGGMFKYQFGAFEGKGHCPPGSSLTCGPTTPNQKDSLLYAGRLVLNLWDPEPGYYNSSTYYGSKNVLAIALSGMHQSDGAGTSSTNFADFNGWNIDFLMERNLGELGVPTLEGAYYHYDLGGAVPAVVGVDNPEGSGFFVLGSYLLPLKIGTDKFHGQLQPMARYQEYDNRVKSTGEHNRIDFGLSYIMDGHNARMTLNYSRDNPEPGGPPRSNIIKFGLQFQI
jgi:hypothetical protein